MVERALLRSIGFGQREEEEEKGVRRRTWVGGVAEEATAMAMAMDEDEEEAKSEASSNGLCEAKKKMRTFARVSL